MNLPNESANSESFDSAAIARYWFTEAEETVAVADHLIEKGDYSYALFFGHLAVEKELKGLHALKQGQHAPPIHNLLRLAKAVGIELDKTKTDILIRITAFNIEASILISSVISGASVLPNMPQKRWQQSKRY